MKTFLLSFLLLHFTILPGFAQNNATRIQEIKKMYAEIAALMKKKDVKKCKTGKATEYDGLDKKKFPFEQKASFCRLSKEYSAYSGNFSGWEWNSSYTYYLKNNKVFFVYEETSAEACADEYRAYYDKKGNIISILNTTNDCEGNTPLKSSEIKDKKEIKRVKSDMDLFFKKILKMLK